MNEPTDRQTNEPGSGPAAKSVRGRAVDGLSASVDVAVEPARVFALWADSAGWPRWDPDLEEAALEGSFASGSRGVLKPRGGPRTRIELTEVVEPESFTAVSRLPGCRMVFEHRAVPIDTGCRVTHVVRFEGLLAFAFRRLIGPSIGRGLPGTMAGLKGAAEARA